jgi:predicted nucleic-acid-binding protein
MNVLIDTNVILDVLLRREPFVQNAARIIVLSEKGFIRSYISASAVTDIFYVAEKELKTRDSVHSLMKNLLKTVHIAAVTENSIHEALDLNWSDFEDSVQYVAGQAISAEYIITRNAKDFLVGSIATLTPDEFLDKITSEDK